MDAKSPLENGADIKPEDIISPRSRFCIIIASLLTLFLGALDALVISAAMPTIVTDLGGLHLYSWVYSAYLLARAVSLPIFGKLADIFRSRRLYVISICLFLLGSVWAGLAQNMTQLIFSRVLQGIGAGGNFALVYIVLTDISAPENRAKTLSLASFIWGLASVLGPTFGGFVVTYFSWRWIFFVNVPLGLFSLLGIVLYVVEVRAKKKDASIDYLGVVTLSTAILGLLTLFMLAGRDYAWISPQIIGLGLTTIAAGTAFYYAEKRAREPILSLGFFGHRGFSIGNAAAFLASFTIFSLFAYSPLFIQGALGKTPLQMSVAMLTLSLGWSIGALVCGQIVHRLGQKTSTILGSLFLAGGGGILLTFSTATSLAACSVVLGFIGVGMGFVSMATLLAVQDSLDITDLGVATASHQFSRTLGGTIGVGISGSFVTLSLSNALESLMSTGLSGLPPSLKAQIEQNIENIFRPEVQLLLAPDVQQALKAAVARGVSIVFWISLLASMVCLIFSAILPAQPASQAKKHI
ncbi:MAG: MDR family MFS transporter [Desulfobacteraceae bacterium]|jgi:EmrB/QacA subfamily drug resistance transporter|nr:MDR family MFS transporter [Desulfobacteraceae bacterium]